MIVRAGSLHGFHVIEPERRLDERGSFERMYCRREYAELGIDFAPVQISVSSNARRGTLRGLHFQAEPHAEAKVVSCTRGSAFDVAVDVRPDSPTYGRWETVELSRENGRAVYVPSEQVARTASRRSRATPSSCTSSRSSMTPRSSEASAGTIPRSRSSGPTCRV